MRVLLVDDNPGIRRLVRRSLEQTNCCTVVGEADTAEASISGVGAYRPDVIVMDWALPGGDGIWATELIKRVYPDVDVVAFTTLEDPDLVERFEAAGAATWFCKSKLAELVEWMVKRAGRGSVPAYL